MSAKLSDLFPVIEDKDKEYTSSFRDGLSNYLYHWPLFILTIVLALTAGYLYLKITNPTYTIKATVIIKDDRRSPDMRDQIPEFNVANQPKLAENELEVFKSRQLVSQVVSNLALWINYQEKSSFKTVNLYDKTPFTFKLIDSLGSLDEQSVKIKINDENTFYLVGADGKMQQYQFNKVVKSEFGNWQLMPTKNLDNFLGKIITVNLSSYTKASERYQKAIEAELPNKLAPVIALTIKDDVAKRGEDILNSLIKFYNQSKIIEKNSSTKKTLAFLDKRIAELADKLNNSESKVEGYRTSQGLMDISSQSKVYLENVQANDNKLNDINIQLNVIENVEESLNNSENIQNASASLGPNYPSLNSLIEKLSTLQSQKDKLLANTPEGNPVFDPINRQINSTKNAIKDNITNIKSSLVTAKSKLEDYGDKFQSSIKEVPVQERQLVDKTREQSTKQNLYVFLLQKREEVSYNYASVVPETKIVDFAYLNSAKLSASPIVYSIALFLGLVFPIGLIYGRNELSNRITTRKEIERGAGVPVFAEVTNVLSDSPIVALDGNSGLFGEEIRFIRTGLNILKGSASRGWVSLITSSISNEGKSFIAANLGLVLAKAGKKTVILEMDLRLPKISSKFNLKPEHPGITDYLSGKCKIDKIVQSSKIYPKLDIISCGTVSPDPSELLEQSELDVLIDHLKTTYDHIIIDTPPINLVTDAKIIGRFQDSVFYVVRQGYTYKSLLSFIKSLKEQQNFDDIKIIFNGIEKGRYGYGHNYGNEYYRKTSVPAKFYITKFLKRF